MGHLNTLKTSLRNRYLIAVYGTLKLGFNANREFLLNPRNVFIGFGTTADAYILTDVGFPYLVDVSPCGDGELKDYKRPVEVELYAVDINTLLELDLYEGYPEHYDRKRVKVNLLIPTPKGYLKLLPFPEEVWIYLTYPKGNNCSPSSLEEQFGTIISHKKVEIVEVLETPEGNIKPLTYTYWGISNIKRFLLSEEGRRTLINILREVPMDALFL